MFLQQASASSGRNITATCFFWDLTSQSFNLMSAHGLICNYNNFNNFVLSLNIHFSIVRFVRINVFNWYWSSLNHEQTENLILIIVWTILPLPTGYDIIPHFTNKRLIGTVSGDRIATKFVVSEWSPFILKRTNHPYNDNLYILWEFERTSWTLGSIIPQLLR